MFPFSASVHDLSGELDHEDHGRLGGEPQARGGHSEAGGDQTHAGAGPDQQREDPVSPVRPRAPRGEGEPRVPLPGL